MKKLIPFLFMLFIFKFGYSQDQIIGEYLTSSRKAIVEIYKSNNKYYGRIIWGTNPRTDYKNPNPKLQSRSLLNVNIMKDFIYNGSGIWQNGTIYDPENGKTYSCMMWLDDYGNLKARGYIGFSFFGRTVTFTKT